jgi:excisionase family DNA binding protein
LGEDTKVLMRVEDVARRLGLSPAAVRHHVRRRHLPAYRIGRLMFFNWEEIVRKMKGDG